MYPGKSLIAVLLSTSLTAISARAATTPYLEDFDDETLGVTTPSEPAPESGQFKTTNGSWSVVSGALAGDREYQNNYNTAVASSSTLNFAGSVGGGLTSDFSISTDFKLDTVTVTSSNITVGLGALGVTDSFGGGGTGPFYLGDVNVGDLGTPGNLGLIRIVRVAGTNTTVAQQVSGVAINTNDTYRLTLQGAYNGGALNLTLTFQNLSNPNPPTGNGSFTVSGSDSTPLTGTYFGYRSRINGGGSLDVNFDNFSVIPEPSAAALLGFAVVGFLSSRRRR